MSGTGYRAQCRVHAEGMGACIRGRGREQAAGLMVQGRDQGEGITGKGGGCRV